MKRFSRAISATLTQQMIQRLVTVSADESVRLASDLYPSNLIVTFMIQNPASNPFAVYLTQSSIQRPTAAFPCIEILPGTAPVFQIPTQTAADTPLVWDLGQYWLIGDDGFEGQTETVWLTAFPLPVV